MKKKVNRFFFNSISVIIFLIFIQNAFAKSIIKAEYFFDSDPGKGNGKLLTSDDGAFDTSSEEVTLNNIDVKDLFPGWHVIYIRGQDSEGRWGPSQGTLFKVNESKLSNSNNSIVDAKFFIDKNLGEGNGIKLLAEDGEFNSSKETVVMNSVSISELTPGRHVVYIRGKDNNGRWGAIQSMDFWIDEKNELRTILEAEYFIDEDPGNGKGIPIDPVDGSFDSSTEDIIVENIDLNGLSLGKHIICIRGKSNDGVWGEIVSIEFDIIISQPLNIITTKLDSIFKGDEYRTTVNISGGTSPFEFSIAYGELPPGLSFDTTNGLISGTPSTNGSFIFSIGVTDSQDEYSEAEYTINVKEQLSLSLIVLRGTLGSDYFHNFEARGGTPPYKFSKLNGKLPPGLNLASDGKISGRPSQTDEFNFVIQVMDSEECTVQQDYKITIDDPLLITTNKLNNSIVGSFFEQPLSASGGYGHYQWLLYYGILPDGLALNTTTGSITGTPSDDRYGTIVISVSDEEKRTVYKDYTLHVTKQLKITTSALPDGLNNEQYSEMILLDGGIGPYAFSHTGELPPGLSLDKFSGIISGTPTQSVFRNIYISVEDSTFPESQTVNKKLSIKTTSRLTILTPTVLPQAQKGNEINMFNLRAGGGPSPHEWTVANGQLPNGIMINSKTGEIFGTSLDWGNIIFTVQVQDANYATAQKEFLWAISDKLKIVTNFIPDGAIKTEYNFTLKADGGVFPYQWRCKNGTMPDGLSLNPTTGTIYGKPTEQKILTFTIEVNDSDAPAQLAESTFTIEILTDDLYIYTPDLPNCRISTAYSADIKAVLGHPPYTWQEKSGQIPPGITLKTSPNSAKLEGIPDTPGDYEFTLEVKDSNLPGKNDTKTYTIKIYDTLTFQTNNLKTGEKSKTYSDSIYITGGQFPYIWRIIQGKLPDGLQLNSGTGHISGIPIGESSEFKLQVEDSGEPSGFAEKFFSIYVADGLTIVTEIIQDGMEHKYYNASLVGVGGILPYHWAVQNGTLPRCFNLNNSNGKISGTPFNTGIFDFIIKLTDSSNPANSASRSFQLKIIPSSILPGDMNNDKTLNLQDALIVMKIIADIPFENFSGSVDVNNDCEIGVQELMFILHEIAE
jgi:hypothetical protein